GRRDRAGPAAVAAVDFADGAGDREREHGGGGGFGEDAVSGDFAGRDAGDERSAGWRGEFTDRVSQGTRADDGDAHAFAGNRGGGVSGGSKDAGTRGGGE